MKLKDKDIRQILLIKLNETYGNRLDTKIFNELGVLHGKSRIDIAVINGVLHGFEIKSESDNLLRLPSQIKDYNAVFDRVTIVTQRCHLVEIRKIVPKWWGIMLVTNYKGKLNIKIIRKGRRNPKLDPYSMCHFLWKEEALEILKERDLHYGVMSKPRNEIYSRIAEYIDIDDLRNCISMKLRSREYETNNLL